MAERNKVKKAVFLLAPIALVLFLYGTSPAQDEAKTTQPKKSETVSDSVVALPKKSPFGALLRSIAFPGGGQFYNRKVLKGSVIFAAESGFIIAAAIEWQHRDQHLKNFRELPLGSADQAGEFESYQFYRDMRNTHLWCAAGVIFLSMLDAYVDAHLFNFEREKMKDVEVSLLPQIKQEKVGVILSINF